MRQGGMRRGGRGFISDRRGIAAVEFAILGSFILLPLFLGLIEILTLYRTDAKLTNLTVNVAQMVSYEAGAANGVTLVADTSADVSASTLSNTSLQDICNGAVTALYPFPAGTLKLAIASVTVESNINGLPTTDTTIHTTSPAYNVWEADFTVSGGSCSASPSTGTALIGTAAAESYATTSPPSTTGTSGWNGMLAVPCDNAIIVQASITYPGMIGVILRSRPKLTQTSFARWANTWTEAELQCSGTACFTSYADSTPICNTTNTSATN